MATYIITFLGLNPQLAEYDFQGNKIITRIFPQALMKVVEFDRMYVCVTASAKEQTFPILAELNDDRIKAVDIEDGEDTNQMWKNFGTIVSKFQAKDKVIFDITHAFRSIPFLTFLFSAYLKVAKQVEIVDVYYGSLLSASPPPIAPPSELSSILNFLFLSYLKVAKQIEIVDLYYALIFANPLQTSPKPPTPATVIQMGGFVSMLDWMAATERFIDLGDGNKLVELLRNLTEKMEKSELKNTIEDTASAIERVSDALIYIRPIEVMKSVAELQYLIPKIKIQGQNLPQLQPFLLLDKQIIDEYVNLALTDTGDLKENLCRQLEMMNWYQNHQQQVKSILLGRELFVSILAFWLDLHPFNKENRQRSEYILNWKPDYNQEKTYQEDLEKFNESIEGNDVLRKYWTNTANIRNDYAHTGMTKSPKNIRVIKKEINDAIEAIKTCLEKFLAVASDRSNKEIKTCLEEFLAAASDRPKKAAPKPKLRR